MQKINKPLNHIKNIKSSLKNCSY